MKLRNKLKNSQFFNNRFGFESNIDITNETEVLYRKNVVIKNIIFLSNIIYTAIFTIAGIGESSNFVLSLVFFPLTFVVNFTLKKMINKNSNDLLKQQIAMYMCCFYMFLSAIIIYLKLKTGSSNEYLGEVGYILLYYSLVISSFYQDKKLLKNIYPWFIIIVSIIHMTLTYDVVFSKEATDGDKQYLLAFLTSNEFKDIILRTFILLLFMLVLYISVSMADYMQKERKKELVKRQEVQEKFINVVTKIFDLTITIDDKELNYNKNLEIITKSSIKLASLLGLEQDKIHEISKFSTVHIDNKLDFKLQGVVDGDERFRLLQEQTDLGSNIIKRIQLEKRTEEIIRLHMDGSETEYYVDLVKTKFNDIDSQIIMLCDMYVTLRSLKSYKRAYNHETTIKYLNENYIIYFDSKIFQRFMKFKDDFNKVYTNDEL